KTRPWLALVPVGISLGALALALRLAPAALPRPQFRMERFLAAVSLTDRGLRLFAGTETPGCAGAAGEAATDRTLQRLDCRRLARLLVADRNGPTLVAASVVEMGSAERAGLAFGELFARAAPRPLRGGALMTGTDEVHREDRYLLIL